MYPIQQLNDPLINAGDLSANITSTILDTSSCIRLCVQAIWAGATPVGTLHVQCSDDGVNFSDDPEVTPIAISGASGNAVAKIVNCSYPYLRLSYVASSGTGSLTVYVSGKNQ